MSTDSLNASPSRGAPPGAREPSEVAAAGPLLGGLTLVGLIVMALGLIGGWLGLAIATVLMLFGVILLARLVGHVAWSRSSAGIADGTSVGAGATERAGAEFAAAEGAREELSSHDLPLGTDAHREVLRRARSRNRLSRQETKRTMARLAVAKQDGSKREWGTQQAPEL